MKETIRVDREDLERMRDAEAYELIKKFASREHVRHLWDDGEVWRCNYCGIIQRDYNYGDADTEHHDRNCPHKLSDEFMTKWEDVR